MLSSNSHGASTIRPNRSILTKNTNYRLHLPKGTKYLRVMGTNANEKELVAVYDVSKLRFCETHGPAVWNTINDTRYPLCNGDSQITFVPLVSPYMYGNKHYQEFEILYVDQCNIVTYSCTFTVLTQIEWE
jgi:hypothetical protein